MLDDGEDEECPVCCEMLDATDKAVNYCDCGYRMCIWCWNRLMETASQASLPGRCPNCRTVYDKDKITMSTVDPEEVMEERKKKKEERKKNPGAMPKNRKDLAHIRVVQRNLVYAVGLPLNLCREELLQDKDYFGKYGKMKKLQVSVNRVGPWAQAAAKGATGSCYVTYYRIEDAVKCIDDIDGAVWSGKTIKACFGTTKYCNAFLKNVVCNNPDCLYLHDIADEADSFYKDEVQDGVQLVRQQLLEALNIKRPKQPAAAAAAAAAAPPVVKAAAAVNAALGAAKAPATAAVAIPLKRVTSGAGAAAAGVLNAWGNTPDTSSPALTGAGGWVAAAAAKQPPLTTGPLAEQEWPSLAPTKDDTDKPTDPAPAEPRLGPWGEKPLSRNSSMGGDAPAAAESAKPTPTPLPTPTPIPIKLAKPAKVITMVKPGKGGKAAAAAVPAPSPMILTKPKATATTLQAADAKEPAQANGGGKDAAAAAQAEPAAAAPPSTPPAGKKGGKGAAAAAKGEATAAAPAVTPAAAAVAMAAASAAVTGRAVDAEPGKGQADAAGTPAGKHAKGPPPGFSAQIRPTEADPAATRVAGAVPSPPIAIPMPSTSGCEAGGIKSIISPSDMPVASPPRPVNNGMLSSLFRTASNGPPPSPIPTTSPDLSRTATNAAASTSTPSGIYGPNPSLSHWLAPSQPPVSTTPPTSAHSSYDGPNPSPALKPKNTNDPAAPPSTQPAKTRPPPGFSQPIYTDTKQLLAAAQTSVLTGDVDVNALFSHLPPTPLEPPRPLHPAAATVVAQAPPRQSRFAFAREEAPPANFLQSHALQDLNTPKDLSEHPLNPASLHPMPQPNDLRGLFQKIAPGANVHVTSMSPPNRDPSPLQGSSNGHTPGTTPQSPNPGLALLAQLQRKNLPADPTPSSAPKGPPPGMPPTFADPAIMAAGKNPHASFQPGFLPGGPSVFAHHRPGELSMGGAAPGAFAAAAGEPPGGMRAPARGPPPGFSSMGTFQNGGAEYGVPGFGAPATGVQRPMQGEGAAPIGQAVPNGHIHEQQKGFAPYSTRL